MHIFILLLRAISQDEFMFLFPLHTGYILFLWVAAFIMKVSKT